MPFDTVESSVLSLQIEAKEAVADSTTVRRSSNPAAFNAGELTCDGTLKDLQLKHPEIYDKLVLHSIGMHIVHECQRMQDRYMEEVKKQRRSG